jgi:predicted Zn-dependent peptidase
MQRVILVGTALALTACSSPEIAPVVAPPELPVQRIAGHNFHRRVLDNGLRAVAVLDDSETVSVFVVVGAGKRHETAGTTGLAHFSQQAFFSGTENLGAGKHQERVQSWGGEAGGAAFDDYTIFYDHRIPPHKVSAALTMEADRLRGLTFGTAALEDAREQVVEHERQQARDLRLRTELVESVVYQRHPYRVGVLDEKGHSNVPLLGTELVERFYNLFYHPNNTCVVIAGAIEPKQALNAIEKAFAALPAGPEPVGVPPEPAMTAARTAKFSSHQIEDRLEYGWVVPSMGDPDRPALEVLAQLLRHRVDFEGRPIEAQVGRRLDAELFRMAASGSNAASTLDQIVAELASSPPSADEMDLAKRAIENDFQDLSLREDPVASLAALFGVYYVLDHSPTLLYHQQWVRQVTPEKVWEAASKYLVAEQRVAVLFEGNHRDPRKLPEEERALADAAAEAASAGQLDRAIEAYTRLLEGKPNKMYTVLYLTERGQAWMSKQNHEAAIADFEEALVLIDYPAVRDLLAKARQSLESTAATAGGGEETQPVETAPWDSPDHQKDLLARLQVARQQLEEWRGLSFKKDVLPEFIEDNGSPATGWYEPTTSRLYVVRGKSDRFSRGTLLRELYHALQDQHFDLSQLRQSGTEADIDWALMGLIEGEALLAVSELMGYDFDESSHLPAYGAVERTSFEKNYQLQTCRRFVESLRERGGWELVAQAFETPPQSSAEIYQPRRYPAGPPDSMDDLPLEGSVVEDTRRGAFELHWMLVQDERIREESGELAGTLEADRFRVVQRDDGFRSQYWDLRFATASEARDFVDRGGAAARSRGWSVKVSGRDVRLERFE